MLSTIKKDLLYDGSDISSSIELSTSGNPVPESPTTAFLGEKQMHASHISSVYCGTLGVPESSKRLGRHPPPDGNLTKRENSTDGSYRRYTLGCVGTLPDIFE